jgi:uncharacterized phage-associated protein
MKSDNLYVFEDVHIVAKYLHSLSPVLSPIKLHKSLYFLFAYYGALYAKSEEEGTLEGDFSNEPLLFNSSFESWAYGAVNREVYAQSKEEHYFNEESLKIAVQEVEKKPEVKQFIDELFDQINSVSDFSLVSRNKQDKAWEEVYEKGQVHIIDQESLITEYRERYL